MKRTLLLSVLLLTGVASASNVSQWNTSAASNNSAPPNGWPESMNPSSVNDSARENMAAIARWYEQMAGDLTTGGTGNAYTLTTTDSHSALADQPLLVFEVDRANTGAATLNVDTLGAKSLRVGGNALVGGEIQADTIIAAAYNATDDAYDIIGGVTGQASLHVSGTTDTDLTDNGNPLNVGTLAGDHLAFDTDSIQAKSDATTATTLLLNDLGGNVELGANLVVGTDGELRVSDNNRVVPAPSSNGAFWAADGDATIIVDSDNNASTGAFRVSKNATTVGSATEVFSVDESGTMDVGDPSGTRENLGFQSKYKTADQTESDTTLVDDDHITGFTLASGGVYAFDLFLAVDPDLDDGFRLAVKASGTFSDGSYMICSATGNNGSDFESDEDSASDDDLSVSFSSAYNPTGFGPVECSGVVFAPAGGGTLKLQWSSALNGASSNAKVGAGSWMTLRALAD